MADVVSAVRSYLLGKSAITSLISQRMYLDERPQKSTLPNAVIYKNSETHEHLVGDRAGHVKTRLQIECYAATRLAANAIAEAIYQSGLCAFTGTTGSVNIRGVSVEDGQRNWIVYNSEAGDDHTYVTQFDFLVSYTE